MEKLFKTKSATAYFSHSKVLYNSYVEELAYQHLQSVFKGKIICPNKDLGTLQEPTDYARIAARQDVVFVFTNSHKNTVSRGCYAEVKMALEQHRKVYFLKPVLNDYELQEVFGIQEIALSNREYGVLRFESN